MHERKGGKGLHPLKAVKVTKTSTENIIEQITQRQTTDKTTDQWKTYTPDHHLVFGASIGIAHTHRIGNLRSQDRGRIGGGKNYQNYPIGGYIGSRIGVDWRRIDGESQSSVGYSVAVPPQYEGDPMQGVRLRPQPTSNRKNYLLLSRPFLCLDLLFGSESSPGWNGGDHTAMMIDNPSNFVHPSHSRIRVVGQVLGVLLARFYGLVQAVVGPKLVPVKVELI